MPESLCDKSVQALSFSKEYYAGSCPYLATGGHDMPPTLFHRFFFPSLNKRYFLRLFLVGLVCFLLFGYILIPLHIQGQSMEPTYRNGSFAFCWRPQYLFSPIQRFEVVTVRFTGRSVMLLKRIIGLPGDTVEFRQGILYLNGNKIEEPYVQYRSDWNLAPRVIAPGHVYVVGDNRGTSMSRHRFGQVKTDRIVGGVLL